LYRSNYSLTLNDKRVYFIYCFHYVLFRLMTSFWYTLNDLSLNIFDFFIVTEQKHLNPRAIWYYVYMLYTLLVLFLYILSFLFVLLYFFFWPLFCLFFFSSIYGFWLPLSYLQILLILLISSSFPFSNIYLKTNQRVIENVWMAHCETLVVFFHNLGL